MHQIMSIAFSFLKNERKVELEYFQWNFVNSKYSMENFLDFKKRNKMPIPFRLITIVSGNDQYWSYDFIANTFWIKKR